MLKRIAIAGGNIAGLSAAYHLARRGCAVTLYEAGIWDKPCGGAITIEFAQYLHETFGINLQPPKSPLPRIRFGFQNGRWVETEGLFIVTSRYDLQKQLVERLRDNPKIDIIFRRIATGDHGLFSPQTILATGFSGFTRQILQENWFQQEHALTLKYEGVLNKDCRANVHLIVFDSRLRGYGWMFLSGENRYNIGIGGMVGKAELQQHFNEFVTFIKNRFDCFITPPPVPKLMWKIPIMVENWETPVSFIRNGIEFIGVGDVLGLAHPVLGAGIEPAWQSGWLLGESYDPATLTINTVKYRHLLKKNLQLTSRKQIDLMISRMLRSRYFPFKDGISFFMLKLFKRQVIDKIKKYPWFAMVHDGSKKTGFNMTTYRHE